MGAYLKTNVFARPVEYMAFTYYIFVSIQFDIVRPYDRLLIY